MRVLLRTHGRFVFRLIKQAHSGAEGDPRLTVPARCSQLRNRRSECWGPASLIILVYRGQKSVWPSVGGNVPVFSERHCRKLAK